MSEKVAKSPAFQFYAAEFLVDENVVLMSNQAVGCYIKLMAYCWREGSIPSEIDKIAKLCGEDGSAMAQLWLSVGECFIAHHEMANRLAHPRLLLERNKQEKHREERAESGRKGAQAKWDKAARKEDGLAIKESMAKNGSSSSSSNSKHKVKSIAPIGDLFPGVSDQVLKDFSAMRKKLRAEITKTAADGIVREAEKAGIPLEDALRMCCERGWRGFNAEWINSQQARAGPKPEKFDPVAHVNRNRVNP